MNVMFAGETEMIFKDSTIFHHLLGLDDERGWCSDRLTQWPSSHTSLRQRDDCPANTSSDQTRTSPGAKTPGDLVTRGPG